jgi:hypothetical protein
MDINEVPQDKEYYKERDKGSKLVYATGKDGKYTSVPTVGWEAEHAATKQAWDAIDEELVEIEQEVKAGRLSPIAWHMRKALMDLPLLARYMDKWQWQVKRHMKPSVFKSLSQQTIEKYAVLFKITPQELTNWGK